MSVPCTLTDCTGYSRLQKLRQWWRKTFAWWVRWLIYLVLIVGLFYVVEDIRGALAWRSFLKEHPEFRNTENVVYDQRFSWADAQLPESLEYYTSQVWFDEFFSSRSRNMWTSRRMEFALLPFRRCANWQPSSVCKNRSSITEVMAANVILKTDIDGKIDIREGEKFFYIRALAIRALAQFELEKYEDSFHSLEDALELADAMDDGTSLLRSNDVSVDLMHCLQLIWQFSNHNRIGAAEAKWIQELLSSIEYQVNSYASAVAYAKYNCAEIESLKWSFSKRKERLGNGWPVTPGRSKIGQIVDRIKDVGLQLFVFLMPNGWLDQNKIFLCSSMTVPEMGMPVYSGFSPYRFHALRHVWLGFRFDPRPTESFIRCGILALAAERYRIDTGANPEAMTDLVPKYLTELVMDPYAPDQPLIYKLEKSRPVIYSIGPNLKDDGGRPRAPIAEGDLVWRYALPDGFTFTDYILY